MSKFSNYLKTLIENSGESIAFLSRTLNIERTSIHKALSDERILPYSSVQSVIFLILYQQSISKCQIRRKFLFVLKQIR